MKRLLDILIVLLAAPIWVPLSLIVGAAIVIFMGRPVLFAQERVGRGGRPFRLLKFRTMRSCDGKDSERITRLGRILRATSLDELPQLLHVLSGEMALVGPRPLPTRYLPRYSPFEARRHEVRPGITGLAQISGRNSISWQEKFRNDVWYVDNQSLALDAKILALTVLHVLRHDGINSSANETMGEFLGTGGSFDNA